MAGWASCGKRVRSGRQICSDPQRAVGTMEAFTSAEPSSDVYWPYSVQNVEPSSVPITVIVELDLDPK